MSRKDSSMKKLSEILALDNANNVRSAYRLGQEVSRQTNGEGVTEDELDEMLEDSGVTLTSPIATVAFDLGSIFYKKNK
jgi:hypothetical protein